MRVGGPVPLGGSRAGLCSGDAERWLPAGRVQREAILLSLIGGERASEWAGRRAGEREGESEGESESQSQSQSQSQRERGRGGGGERERE